MTRRATIGLVAFLTGLVSVGWATEMTWQGTCSTTDWFDTCHIGQCGGGENKLFNNWGQESCAPTQPAFPGTADAAVILTSATLGSGEARVGWLTLSSAGSSLDVGYPETDVIVQSLLTNWGLVELHDEGGIEVWGGSIANNGTILLRAGGYAGGGVFEVPVDVILGGSGSLVLQSNDGRVEGSGLLTHAAGHTIRGSAGSIIAPLVNEGLVRADVDGGSIVLTSYHKTNNGVIEAMNGGDIAIATTVTQGAAGRIVADGTDSVVHLRNGASVIGGTLASTNGGTVWTSGGGVTAIVEDVVVSGDWGVENGATVAIEGATLTNDGTIEAGLYTGSYGWPQLIFTPGVTLAGSGELKTSKSYLRGGPFTNAATHTIHGWSGTIEAELVNHGTVDSDTAGQVMTLSAGAKSNEGLIRASNGGDLNISTEIVQGALGHIVADGTDSFVNLRTGAHIVGGALATSGEGRIWTSGGDVAPEVTDVTLNGYWGIENGADPVFTGATLTNDGTIEAGLYMGGAGAPVLHVESPLALAGSGELYFSGGRLATAAGVTWINAAGHTIHGRSASVAASMVNRGVIAADWSGQELRVYAQEPGITNEGLIRADAGCTLRLYGADLFTQGAGETRVEGSLELSGGPLDLDGGRLAGGGSVHGSVDSSGGTVSPGSSVGTLTVDGDYTQGAGGQLIVELAGTGAGHVDVLEVDGTASLDGILYVTTAGGFQPLPGDSFTILEADVRSGEFDHVASWADSDCSLGFDVAYNAGSVVITAVDGAAGVFCSNLETGDTSDWSNAVP